jgi:hypothetical protein
MDSDKTLRVSKLRREFPSKPPTHITQQPFDSGPKHLGTLARLHPGERPRANDLWEYTQDLLYGGEIQDELLTYLLPFCLEAWRDDLHGLGAGYGGFVEHFYPVLANKHVFDVRLKPTQTSAVSHFMRESILQEIESQRGLTYSGTGARPYRWIRALTTYGVLLTDVDQLWQAWWSSDTIGAAISIVQYASCLMYSQNENPVFAPWTPDAGGGPPSLWEFEGHLYEHRWLEPNVQFMRQNLNVGQVSNALDRAVERLAGQPEHEIVSEVRSDLPLCVETLAARCAELPSLLETVTRPLEWRI